MLRKFPVNYFPNLSFLLVVTTSLFLSSCDQSTLMKRYTPPEAEAAARNYVELLRSGEFEQIKNNLDLAISRDGVDALLAEMAALFPSDPPKSVKVVGLYMLRDKNSPKTEITLEYEFQDKWLLVTFDLQEREDIFTITTFNVSSIPNSVENAYAFRLSGKSIGQYLVLSSSILCLLFIIHVLISCFRTPGIKLKWLWMLFILTGAGKLTSNWTTGETLFTLLAVQIPCAGMSRILYEPWIVFVYFPIGAISFLNYRWKLKVGGKLLTP